MPTIGETIDYDPFASKTAPKIGETVDYDPFEKGTEPAVEPPQTPVLTREEEIARTPLGGIGVALKSGVEARGVGRLLGRASGLISPEIKQDVAFAPTYVPETTGEKIAYGAGSLLSDLPAFMAGQGIVGGAAKAIGAGTKIAGVAGAAAGGGLAEGGGTALAKAEGLPGTEKESVLNSTLRGMVSMGPLGLFGPSKSILEAITGRAAGQAASVSLASALYDAAAFKITGGKQGKPLDFDSFARETAGNAPVFAIMNLFGAWGLPIRAPRPGQPLPTPPIIPEPATKPPETPLAKKAAEVVTEPSKEAIPEAKPAETTIPAPEGTPAEIEANKPPEVNQIPAKPTVEKSAVDRDGVSVEVGDTVFISNGKNGKVVAVDPDGDVAIENPETGEIYHRGLNNIMKTKKGATDATRIRSDEGQVPPGRVVAPRSEGEGGKNLQQPPQTGPETGGATQRLTVGARVKVSNNPTPHTIEEVLPQSEVEAQNGEQYYLVKNQRTGNTEMVESYDLTTIGEGKPKEPARDLDAEIAALGKDPSVFSNATQKKAALKRWKEKGEAPPPPAPAKSVADITADMDKRSLRVVPESTRTPVPGETKAPQVPQEQLLGGLKKSISEGKAERAQGKLFEGEPAKIAPRERGVASRTGAMGVERQTQIERTQASPEAIRQQEVFDNQRKAIANVRKFTWSNLRDKLDTAFVSMTGPIRRRLEGTPEGERVLTKLIATQGAKGEAARQFEDAEKEIASHLSHKNENGLSDYLQSKRTIEVSQLKAPDRNQLELFPEFVPEGLKNPGGLGIKEAEAYIRDFEAQHPQEAREIQAAAEKFWTQMRTQLDQLHSEGLVGDNAHEFLVKTHKFYAPRLFIQHLDKTISGVGKTVNVTDSGVHRLGEGSEQALLNDWRHLLGRTIAITQNRVFKNRANRELFNYVDANPRNPIGATIEKPVSFKDGKPTYGDVPSGMARLTYFDKGMEKHVLIPTELAESWVSSAAGNNQEVREWLQWITGVKPLKTIVTGINPEFAVTNVPRDALGAWFKTTQYSKHLPISVVQQLGDYATVWKDAWNRTGRTVEWSKEGGSMDFLSSQGMPNLKTVQGESMQQFWRGIGKLNQFSELLTRLALRERGIKNGLAPEEATRVAREYMNFSEGGSVSKTLDDFIPYFNAAIQGTRGTIRAFKTNPKVATYKVAQLLGIGAGLAFWNRKINPDAWDEISSRTKAMYFIVTTPFSYSDANGKKRYVYFGLPKDQSQQIFSSLGSAMAEKMSGNDVDAREIQNALTQLSPTGIENIVWPTASALMSYAFNKDFFRNRDIWQGGPVSPKNEYTKLTPEAAIWAGQITGMSPDRLANSVTEVLPSNGYTALMGMGFNAVKPNDEMGKAAWDHLTSTPMLRRFVRTTYPANISEEDIKFAQKHDIDINMPSQKIRQAIAKEKTRRADELIEARRAGEPIAARHISTKEGGGEK